MRQSVKGLVQRICKREGITHPGSSFTPNLQAHQALIPESAFQHRFARMPSHLSGIQKCQKRQGGGWAGHGRGHPMAGLFDSIWRRSWIRPRIAFPPLAGVRFGDYPEAGTLPVRSSRLEAVWLWASRREATASMIFSWTWSMVRSPSMRVMRSGSRRAISRYFSQARR